MNRQTFTIAVSAFAAAICAVVILIFMMTCESKKPVVIEALPEVDQDRAAVSLSENEEQTAGKKFITDILETTLKLLENLQPEETESEKISPNTAVPLVSYQTSRPMSAFSGLSGKRSGMGVNFSEINPINYENPDLDVLRHMGADQYLISFLQGEKYYKNAEYDRAIAEYTSSLNRHPGFIEAIISRGNAWMKKRDFARAIDDYNRAIRIDGKRAELYNYRGFARAERGETRLAIEDYTSAISINRSYIDALVNRSHAYYQTGDYEKTIEDCDRVISLQPSNAVVWNRRGSAWYAREDDDKAIRDFSEAIRLRNDYALAWYNRGNAWYSKGDTEKALADINRCLAINPSYAAARTARDNILR